MNEEYLWDKTGDDSEISRIEETLSVFRFDPGSVAPVPVVRTSERSPRSWSMWFRLAFTGAALSSAGLLIALFFFAGGQVDSTGQTALTTGSDTSAGSDRLRSARSETTSEPVSGEAHSIVPIKITTSARSGPAIEKRAKAKAKAKPTYTYSAGLTAREKYAYEQLKLALSIAGSKLRIVQDSVNGSESEDRTDKR